MQQSTFAEVAALNAYANYAAVQDAVARRTPLAHRDFGALGSEVVDDIAKIVGSVAPAATNLYTAISNASTASSQVAAQQQLAQQQLALQGQIAALNASNTGLLSGISSDTILYLGIGAVALFVLMSMKKKAV